MRRFRSRIALVCATALTALGAARPASAAWEDGRTTSVHLLGGWKFLNHDWSPADTQTEFGAQLDYRPGNWPVRLTGGVLHGDSSKKSVPAPGIGTATAESESTEVQLGLRKYLDLGGRVLPSIAGGFDVVHAQYKSHTALASDTSRDTGMGIWLGAGADYLLTQGFGIEVQALYSIANVDVADRKTNAGGLHLLGGLAFHW